MAKAAAKAWSTEQREVIEAAASARMLVQAGPGTGKTDVACARVGWLIDDEGLRPKSVLLISFTRTAVAEIRARILGGAVDEMAARSVRITTIDSQAWQLRAGFEEEETKALGGDVGFESNLARLRTLLHDRDEGLLEFLERIEHLIVDEAQDVVGLRAHLLFELMGALDAACGVTVFADRGQAIYGFADGDDDEDRASFLELLSAAEPSFQNKKLSRIYRTEHAELQNLFTNSRGPLLCDELAPPQRYREVFESVSSSGGATPEDRNHADLQGNNDALVLYRRRAEALMASSFLSQAGVEHRLRMSGLPIVVYPWIAVLLSAHVEPYLSRTALDERYHEHRESPALAGVSADEAWDTLFKAARKDANVDLRRLRELLARPRPPVELCQSEVGTSGPILSTIHASKGREARLVRLMLSRDSRVDQESDGVDWNEESRVIYVGATRARETFEMGKGFRAMPIRMESGRVVERRAGGYFCQVGADGDVEPTRHILGEGASDTQRQLAKLAARTTPAWTYCDRNRDWRHVIEVEVDDDPFEIGELTKSFGWDLKKVADHARCPRTPGELRHLYVFGVKTVAVPFGQSDHLPAPFSRSGLFLAPVIKGYVKQFSRGKRKKK